MIPLKSDKELDLIRKSGSILAVIMRQLEKALKPGVTTADIDKLAESLVIKEGVLPAFKGYKGYPACVCISINEEIVHGIPGTRKIQDGDIVSLDMGINYKGYFSDAAITVGIGKISPQAKGLINVTRKALSEGIKQAKAGNRLSDISNAIQNYVERYGYSVVRQFVGHGIGKALHEEPEVPNFGIKGQGPVLIKGMVLAIEPMVNLGTWECEILDNGWTAVTKDRLLSAHFEHTVAIMQNKTEILTL